MIPSPLIDLTCPSYPLFTTSQNPNTVLPRERTLPQSSPLEDHSGIYKLYPYSAEGDAGPSEVFGRSNMERIGWPVTQSDKAGEGSSPWKGSSSGDDGSQQGEEVNVNLDIAPDSQASSASDLAFIPSPEKRNEEDAGLVQGEEDQYEIQEVSDTQWAQVLSEKESRRSRSTRDSSNLGYPSSSSGHPHSNADSREHDANYGRGSARGVSLEIAELQKDQERFGDEDAYWREREVDTRKKGLASLKARRANRSSTIPRSPGNLFSATRSTPPPRASTPYRPSSPSGVNPNLTRNIPDESEPYHWSPSPPQRKSLARSRQPTPGPSSSKSIHSPSPTKPTATELFDTPPKRPGGKKSNIILSDDSDDNDDHLSNKQGNRSSVKHSSGSSVKGKDRDKGKTPMRKRYFEEEAEEIHNDSEDELPEQEREREEEEEPEPEEYDNTPYHIDDINMEDDSEIPAEGGHNEGDEVEEEEEEDEYDLPMDDDLAELDLEEITKNPQKGSGSSGSAATTDPKGPTLDDLFQDDDDDDVLFPEFNTSFSAKSTSTAITKSSKATTSSSAKKPLSILPTNLSLPWNNSTSSSSTTSLLTSGIGGSSKSNNTKNEYLNVAGLYHSRKSQEMGLDNPLMFISDLEPEEQDFYINHGKGTGKRFGIGKKRGRTISGVDAGDDDVDEEVGVGARGTGGAGEREIDDEQEEFYGGGPSPPRRGASKRGRGGVRGGRGARGGKAAFWAAKRGGAYKARGGSTRGKSRGRGKK